MRGTAALLERSSVGLGSGHSAGPRSGAADGGTQGLGATTLGDDFIAVNVRVSNGERGAQPALIDARPAHSARSPAGVAEQRRSCRPAQRRAVAAPRLAAAREWARHSAHASLLSAFTVVNIARTALVVNRIAWPGLADVLSCAKASPILAGCRLRAGSPSSVPIGAARSRPPGSGCRRRACHSQPPSPSLLQHLRTFHNSLVLAAAAPPCRAALYLSASRPARSPRHAPLCAAVLIATEHVVPSLIHI